MNALRCQRACSFVLCGFDFFLARCFGLRSLRIHDGVFVYMYIYIQDIYIYLVCLRRFLTGAFAHVKSLL